MKHLVGSIGLFGGFVLFLSWLGNIYFPQGARPEATRKQRIIYATYLSAPAEKKDHFISEFRNTSESVLNVALSRGGPTRWTAVDFSWNIQ
ncbi:hypothetical protein N7449_008433 [Penicillium cf. viridicatum]|uniref:Uncharacterized protein n=1 Tax=Penicillium cf. viridicatum TaxID=2972119 RepID=A0A9W9JAF9_9EURO|nr:hypothetical protein N7449_008433 [Penicillium cf. viridicatum]